MTTTEKIILVGVGYLVFRSLIKKVEGMEFGAPRRSMWRWPRRTSISIHGKRRTVSKEIKELERRGIARTEIPYLIARRGAA